VFTVAGKRNQTQILLFFFFFLNPWLPSTSQAPAKFDIKNRKQGGENRYRKAITNIMANQSPVPQQMGMVEVAVGTEHWQDSNWNILQAEHLKSSVL